MTQIIDQIIKYLNHLDWSYILTFILLAYAINKTSVLEWFFRVTQVKIQTRYRVLFIGVLYGIALFFIRGYSLEKVECLLQSFVFAMVFHKLLIDKIIEFVLNTKRVPQ